MDKSGLRRLACSAALGISASLAGVSAHAGNVQWSIGIEAPLYPGSVSTLISSAPHGYYPPPREFLPPQPRVIGWPRPVYYVDAPPPVYYRPAPVYYRPQPVYRPHWKHRRDYDRCDD